MSKFSKFFQLLVAAVLLLGMVGPAALPAPAGAAKAHPLLLQMAAEDPGQRVAVIVQKADKTGQVETLVTQLGGAVTKDLHIINAFAAELSAGAALELARHADVRWVSPDALMKKAGGPGTNTNPTAKPNPNPDPSSANMYLDTLGVRSVWGMGLNGAGIGVAVIDSGISPLQDLTIKKNVSFNPLSTTPQDVYGHGTHVAGIIAGNGTLSGGQFLGVAPGVYLINLKVCDETGMASESDVVAAMQWIYDNRVKLKIKVVNISLNSTVEQSYHTSPLDAAAEILWFNGIVVVVSAGNHSSSGFSTANAAPANDPFVITVGASNEMATSVPSDDFIALYSAFGRTMDGYTKPNIIAPGSNIISLLSSSSDWDIQHPERVVMNDYFRLSGTSMAAPMVTGAVALLLQDEPRLTPDQVKYRLLNSGRSLWGVMIDKSGYPVPYQFPYLDVYAAVTGGTKQSANTGLTASQLLWTGGEPITWGSVSWNSVSWNSVSWNSVSWNSVSWNSVSWNSAYWGP